MTTRIYTRTGDAGQTGLFGGSRVLKSDSRVEAYGSVDELNAVIGWALTQLAHPQIQPRLTRLQPDLFAIGAHLATHVREGRPAPKLPALPAARIVEMETWIDEADAALPELNSFIMPGGSPGGAALHVARTVCRRAERAVVALMEHGDVPGDVVTFLNRLSDLLFVWARLENHDAGATEHAWLPGSD